MTPDEIEVLKDRPYPPKQILSTDDERDQIDETYAAVREHVAELMEEIHSPDRPKHAVFERRMRRISIMLWQIRKIEDDVRERDRVRRNTPLEVDMSALDDEKASLGDHP